MKPVENTEINPAGVSVVICCYNSAARLPETIRHLARQVVSASIPWEVVVINNASTDNTAEIPIRVWQEAGSPAPLHLIEEVRPGKSFALEAGFTAAQYDVTIIVDDDNWLNPDYLERAFQIMFQHPKIGALGGKITANFEVEPPKWFQQFQSCYAVGAQGKATGDITDYKSHVAGAGMVVRKSAYQRLKQRGFYPILSDGKSGILNTGEDLELCYAMAILGYRIWYDDTLCLTHFMPKARLTQNSLLGLICRNQVIGPTLACYEAALRRPDDSALMIYWRGLWKHGGWTLKSLVKFLLGREEWMTCYLQWLDFWHSLTALTALRRAFKFYYPEIIKLKKPSAAN
jgi:glycosyltransferase involved in cell wall biosynthesis